MVVCICVGFIKCKGCCVFVLFNDINILLKGDILLVVWDGNSNSNDL